MMTLRDMILQLFVVVDPEHKTPFGQIVTRQNMTRVRAVAITTLLVELAMLMRSVVRIATGVAGEHAKYYASLYLIMALMMAVGLLFYRSYAADTESGLLWAGIIAPLGTTLALLWAAVVTLTDLTSGNEQGIVLIAMQYLLMVVFLIPPYASLAMLFAAQIVVVVGIYLLYPDAGAYSGTFINTTINALLAWVVSRVVYAGAYRQFLANRTIQEKNNQLSKLNTELAELSVTDPLTFLMNRRRFDETVDAEWRRACRDGQRLTIAIADVDDFKQYNDIYGHQEGDVCLRKVADAMRSELRRANDTLARFGGEEFIILLRGEDAEKDRQLLMRVKDSVENLQMPHSGSRAAPVVTVSIGGFSAVPAQDSDAQAMIRQADEALYAAKDGGRNKLVFRNL